MDVPPITGVAEVVLSVRDIPAMQRFYTEVLGFRFLSEACSERAELEHPTGQPTIVFLTIAELDTPLGQHSHHQVLVLIDYHRHASHRPGHQAETSTLHHLAFEIPAEAYKTHHERLVALGLEPRAVKFPNINARALFFKDSEGNNLELICPDLERD